MKKLNIKDDKKILRTDDFNILAGMFLALGCDQSAEQSKTAYLKLKKVDDATSLELSLEDFAQLVNTYVDEECDPVEGVIEAIAELYDKKRIGYCEYAELTEFMKKHNYLEGEPAAVMKVLSEFKEGGDMINYVKAIKKLIQD